MGDSGNAPSIESEVQIYRCPSSGKINLRLVVFKKRKDGYHEVITLLTWIRGACPLPFLSGRAVNWYLKLPLLVF